MQQSPALFAQMRENLDPARVPKIHAETVAKQTAGLLALVDQFITPNADQLEGDDRKRLGDAVATMRTAVAGQQEWLEIGKTSCWDNVCQDVSMSVGAISVKKKTNKTDCCRNYK